MNFNQNKFIVFCCTIFLRIIVEITAEDDKNITSGVDSFKQGLYGLKDSDKKCKKLKKNFLYDYHKELFDRATVDYEKDIIQSPVKWCLDNLKDFNIDVEGVNAVEMCKHWSAKEALSYAYFRLKNPETLRSPRQFCDPDIYPHPVTDTDDLMDDNQQPKDKDPSEIPSTSASVSGRSMFVHSFDLNETYIEDE